MILNGHVRSKILDGDISTIIAKFKTFVLRFHPLKIPSQVTVLHLKKYTNKIVFNKKNLLSDCVKNYFLAYFGRHKKTKTFSEDSWLLFFLVVLNFGWCWLDTTHLIASSRVHI